MNQYVFEYEKPVVQTKFGKLRGVTYGGVNIYMGIPYARAKRFHMPSDPDSWDGVKDAYTYGSICYQPFDSRLPSYYRGLHMRQTQSEDCQNLNIWAPKTISGEKKPVFVWIHGGGFFGGSALEEYSFDGFNLANHGDIIFVSINHRLNILGFTNLEEYGVEFGNSVNAGIADLVAALKWIHENIEAFGGDPQNVTICGHSGGGGKVQCLYQIEEAAPWFQRGIVLSGAFTHDMKVSRKDSRAFTHALLDELGITKENINDIYKLSYNELLAAYRKVSKVLTVEGINCNWGPVSNDYLPGFPDDIGFMPGSADKPILYSSTLGEFPRVKLDTAVKEAFTEQDKEHYLRKMFGESTDHLMSLFKKAYPDHDILDLAYMDSWARIATVKAALAHSKNGKGNTYLSIAAYNVPENGWIPVWHGGEVGYVFMNEDKVYVLNEPVYGQKLSRIYSTMVLNYVKCGDPNNQYLPAWLPVDNEHRYTMIIDRKTSRCVESHDEELVALCDRLYPKVKSERLKNEGGKQ